MSRVSAQQRGEVTKRAEACCEYCRTPQHYTPEIFAVDHVIPISLGGETTLDNLALSCNGCNGHKYNRTAVLDPVTREIAPLYDPRRQRWEDHFAWDEDYSLVIGITPTGRATIAALQLNREGVVNLRELLRAAGKHPLRNTNIEEGE